MILGMTGTRNPLTTAQLRWMAAQVATCDVLHHGACVGADEAAHDAAVAAGKRIVIHPPTDERLMMPRSKFTGPGIEVCTAHPYNTRNRHIVRDAARMIAFPDGPYRRGSGTWNTIGFTTDASKVVAICYPDGTVEVRSGATKGQGA